MTAADLQFGLIWFSKFSLLSKIIPNSLTEFFGLMSTSLILWFGIFSFLILTLLDIFLVYYHMICFKPIYDGLRFFNEYVD